MRPDIHPNYKELNVTCSCGHNFVTRSASKPDTLRVEVCMECHPFFTGKQKLLDTEGRVEQFRKRFGSFKKPADSAPQDQA